MPPNNPHGQGPAGAQPPPNLHQQPNGVIGSANFGTVGGGGNQAGSGGGLKRSMSHDDGTPDGVMAAKRPNLDIKSEPSTPATGDQPQKLPPPPTLPPPPAPLGPGAPLHKFH